MKGFYPLLLNTLLFRLVQIKVNNEFALEQRCHPFHDRLTFRVSMTEIVQKGMALLSLL